MWAMAAASRQPGWSGRPSNKFKLRQGATTIAPYAGTGRFRLREAEVALSIDTSGFKTLPSPSPHGG